MRQYLITLLAAMFSLSSFAQSTHSKEQVKKEDKSGYNIPITLTPYKNTWVYLGCYFGKYKNLADSVYLDEKSQGVFKGSEKLPRGIYFTVSPQKYLLFELDQNRSKYYFTWL